MPKRSGNLSLRLVVVMVELTGSCCHKDRDEAIQFCCPFVIGNGTPPMIVVLCSSRSTRSNGLLLVKQILFPSV